MRDVGILDIDSITGEISFNLRKATEVVEGRQALLQLITLSLLNDRGSNAYDTNKGSLVTSILRNNYGEDDEQLVSGLITLAISDLEAQIIQEQAVVNFTEDDLDSKLKKLEVFDVNFNQDTNAWEVKITVTTEANNVGIIGL